MAEVVNSHPVESGAGSDTPPGVLQVGEVPARLAARDHTRIVLIAGQGGQQPYGGGRKRDRPPAGLGVWEPKLACVEIDMLPAESAYGWKFPLVKRKITVKTMCYLSYTRLEER